MILAMHPQPMSSPHSPQTAASSPVFSAGSFSSSSSAGSAPRELLLPPLAALPSLSISPPNSSMCFLSSPSHAFAHDSVAPLGRALPRSCHLLGCANFAKIHGLCAAHFHGDEAASSTSSSASSTVLPPLRMDHPHALERPKLPAYYHQHQHHSSLYAQSPSLPSLAAARRFSEPAPLLLLPPPQLSFRPASSPLHRRQRTDSFTAYRRSPSAAASAAAAAAAGSHTAGLKPSPTHSAASSSVSPSSSAAPKALCRRDNCGNAARRKGLCMEHGGRHFCKMDGCSKCAHRGGYCIAHGGGRRCAVEQCTKSAQSGGVCYSHGGGKRCATDGCSHAARSGGFCIKHGKMLLHHGGEDDATAANGGL